MITKAVIEKVIDKYSAVVRIPIFNGSANIAGGTPVDELDTATLCSLPNIIPKLSPGDIVYVGFEDNDYGQPVILGYLGKSDTSTKCDIDIDSLTVNTNADLPKQTIIGKVEPKSIEGLYGTEDNLAWYINNLNSAGNVDTITIAQIDALF